MTTTPNVSRRNFLLGGLALAAAPGLAHGASATAPLAASCIVLYLHGGASQLETFDPKPGSKTGGPTRAIATAQDGVRFAASLPLLAARADALAIIRTLSAREGNHDRARYLMRTGHAPQGGVVHPGLAAMVSALHPEPALVGRTAEERAQTRQWWRRVELNVTEFIHNAFHYAEGLPRFTPRIPVAPEAAEGLKRIAQDRLTWLDGLFGAGPYLCGERFTAADIWLYVWLDFGAGVNQPFDHDLPKIAPWFERVATRPSASASRQLLSAP